ncbi:MAG: carboxypeptidase-like regulatory domain-containing protein, partial [Parafilimonas sp.]
MKYLFTFLTLFTLFTFVTFSTTHAQKFTLNGYISDSLSGEALTSASVTIKEVGKSISANQYGFYSLTLSQGNYQLIFSYIGYQPKVVEINLIRNTSQNIALEPVSATINEVTVSARKKESNTKSAQMGKIDLNINTIKSLPVIFGEVDVLKTLQLLPGVRNAGEGNAGFYVRGGGPDQNLIMLDEAVVYNTGHLFGFFSVFNSDAIKSISLIKGGMPPQYGGRLSSVIDITMKEGNMNKTEVDAGIGLIASRIAIQGPIKKDKASYMLSARRTYIDALIKPFISKSSSFYGSGYYFYDLNAKMNYRFTDKDRIYLSGYFGRDKFIFNNARRSFTTSIPWGNSTATFRWNHVFNKKLFSNLTLVYNDYKFDFFGTQDNFKINL